MPAEKAHCVQEPAAARVSLRRDLIFRPQWFGEDCCYVVEDRARSKFFRLGVPEYTLVSLLDGRSIAEAVAAAATALGPQALAEADALALCHWLIEAGLATTQASSDAGRLHEQAGRIQRRRVQGWLNPLVLKLPLVNPDRALEAALPWFGWLFSRWFFPVWVLVCTVVLGRLLVEWDGLCAASRAILDPGNWLRMAIAWTALKFLHEAAHALACKKYGGNVLRAGLMLIVLAPVGFVDVTSAWRFRSKWQRMATAAAGMYVELFVAAVAFIAWGWLDDGLAKRFCYDVALLAGVSTILFNANPLLRFDGYYLLADWSEVPNLYGLGQQYIQYLVKKYVLGLEVIAPSMAPAKARFIKCYGAAALVWRVLLYLTLSLALIGWLSYLGALIALAFAIAWFIVPAFKSVRRLKTTCPVAVEGPRRRKVAAIAAAVLALASAAALMRPGTIVAPAVVEYAPLVVLRAGGPGFVTSVLVESGDRVEAGQTLLTLRNFELAAEVEDLKLELAQSAIKQRVSINERDQAKQQVEAAAGRALEEKIRELQKQLSALTVRAPISGRVVGRKLAWLDGQYLKEGDEIAVVGRENAKELIVAVTQDDLELFAGQLGRTVEVRVATSDARELAVPLTELDPRASLEPPHAALAAHTGGPLPVKLKQQAATSTAELRQTYELLSPSFLGTVTLTSEQSAQVRAGQPATVRFKSTRSSVGARLLQSIGSWIDQQIRRAQS